MRIVVKAGTHLITKENYSLNTEFLDSLVAQIASLHKEGHEIILVSSGAVASGRSRITFEKEAKNIPFRQILAAVGQGILIQTYSDLFKKFGIVVAQALLTNYDFVNRENFLNTREVFEHLLQNRIIPIVNENDVTTTAELKFGDNDMLSGHTSAMISADLLVLMTTVDGLYIDDPKKNKNARLISFVTDIDKEILKYAKKSISKDSLGGMISKINAADYAVSSGIQVVICNGLRTNALREIMKNLQNEEKIKNIPGTFFPAKISKIQSFKKWMKPKILKDAKIIVDDGALNALRKQGKSLLASGITEVSGNFSRGDIVKIFDLIGKEIGYGQTNYSSGELRKIKGKKSSQFANILGYSLEEEVMHRDRMVIQGDGSLF